MSKKFFRLVLFCLPIAVFLFVLLTQTRAGTISSITVTPEDNSIGATSAYTIKFTPATNLPNTGVVLLRFIFPSGVTFGLAGTTLDTAVTSPEITAVDNSQGGQPQLLRFTTTGLTAGTAYTIKIRGVINPGNAGMGIVAVATSDAGSYVDGNLETDPPSTLSPSFEIGTAAFKGKVTKASDGTPVYNAWVDIFPTKYSGKGDMPSGTSTNYNGDYLISTTNVNSGTTYRLEANPPWNNSANLISSGDEITYNGSSVTKNFALPVATKRITGKVSYRDTGAGVSGATINAFKMNGSGYAQTTTDSSGNYELKVGGGNWGVMPQQSQDSDWSYGDEPGEVKFADDASSEGKTINFTVDRASSTIRGCLVKPNGQPVDPQVDRIGGVGVFSREGKGGGGPLDNKGCFSIKVPAGTYILDIWTSPESNYGPPSLDPITVKDGQTRKLGSIKLTKKDATIKGTVKDKSGKGIDNIQVNAFVRDGGGFSQATTNSSGKFSLKVGSGRWMVMPFFTPTDPYALNDPPQEVSVSSGGTTTVNFVVKKASSTINGTVVDENSSPVSVYGYAFAETAGGGMFGPGGLGGPIEKGSFSFKVPAGTYTVNVGLAPGSGYTSGDGTSVTIADGETKNITVTLKPNDATITGSIVDDSGNPISNLGDEMFIFAVSGANKGHTFQQGTISGSKYTIKVAAGDWALGYFIDPSSGYMSAPPDPSMKLSVTSGGTATKNITLKAANARISGTVYQPDGTTPATGVFVSVDSRETEGKEFFNGSPTDSNGQYTIPIASGTYKIRANVAPDSGYLSPAEQNVAVAANETKTVNFTLRQSDATITGSVALNGSGVPAFVYAWAEDGGFAQSMANSSGAYSLSVSKGTIWHVGAHYETGITPYESKEITVNMTGSTATANLTLSQASYSLPQALTTTFDATKPKLITLTDGTEINIPANALATSGNVTLTINPKASLPTKKGDKPIWYGYEFSATDSNGQTITSFNSSVTIVFPYSDDQLKRLGITADDLVPSYWDETSGTWKKVFNVTVDTTNKTVTITVDHFTDFALTANATGTIASTTSTTSSSSPTTASSTKPSPGFPEIYARQGAVINKHPVVAIVEEGTLPWDSYLSMTIHQKKHPYHIGTMWQVSDIYDLWFRSFFNDAKILYPDKPSIFAIRYEKSQLGELPEDSLKLAYSSDEGKTWKILPTSVLDKKSKTVAALTKKGGYYMLVAGYGGYSISYASQPAKVVSDKKTVKKIIKEEKKSTPTVTPKQTIKKLPTKPTPKKSLLQRILDFIFRRWR